MWAALNLVLFMIVFSMELVARCASTRVLTGGAKTCRTGLPASGSGRVGSATLYS